MLFQQDLHSEVATQVRVSALEHGPHAAVADLTQNLVPPGLLGHLAGRGANHRRFRLTLGVAQQHARDGTARLGQPGQYAADQGTVEVVNERVCWPARSRSGMPGMRLLPVRKNAGDNAGVSGKPF